MGCGLCVLRCVYEEVPPTSGAFASANRWVFLSSFSPRRSILDLERPSDRPKPSRKLSILRYRMDLTAARVGIDRIRSGLGIFDRDRNGIEAALVGPFGEDGLIGMISVRFDALIRSYF